MLNNLYNKISLNQENKDQHYDILNTQKPQGGGAVKWRDLTVTVSINARVSRVCIYIYTPQDVTHTHTHTHTHARVGTSDSSESYDCIIKFYFTEPNYRDLYPRVVITWYYVRSRDYSTTRVRQIDPLLSSSLQLCHSTRERERERVCDIFYQGTPEFWP